MKGLLEFKIIIDDDSLQGKLRCIKGHVLMTIGDSKVSRKEIKVKYICKAWTDWKEVNYLKGGIHFKEMQLLAKHKTVLHQTQEPSLEPGEHVLPFEFNIPISTLPPSFVGPYGRIRHRIKAVFRSTNILESAVKDEWEFYSSPVQDLNTQAEQLMDPIAVDKTIYGVLGRLAKPVKTIKVTLNKSGYVPGEGIIVTIETNRNKETRHPIEANLRQVVQFIGSSIQSLKPNEKRTIANVLNTVTYEEFPESTAEMCCIIMPELIVPPTPPSGLIGCKIISLEYDVMISNKEFDIQIPVVIGNVPLHTPASGPACQVSPPSFEELPQVDMADMCETKEPLPP